jgi:hypothetical protein
LAGELVLAFAGFFVCFSGSAAQVVELIAARLSANTPIATMTLEPLAILMTTSDSIASA